MFMSNYVKEEIVHIDHLEVIFNVVFSFIDNEVFYKLSTLTECKPIVLI